MLIAQNFEKYRGDEIFANCINAVEEKYKKY
jgi:hypothetical protein